MVKYYSIQRKWIEISEEKALENAKRLYKLRNDLKRINKRFYGIQFTEEDVKNGRKRVFAGNSDN